MWAFSGNGFSGGAADGFGSDARLGSGLRSGLAKRSHFVVNGFRFSGLAGAVVVAVSGIVISVILFFECAQEAFGFAFGHALAQAARLLQPFEFRCVLEHL